jgi:peptidoglycan/xylan/chitin deacetylase (PgdA/CDA1 family)
MDAVTDGPAGRSGPIPVALTFDVDAESGWLAEGEAFRTRLSTLSEGRYGVARGLPRILALLHELGLPATFYVPGLTAELHPEVVPALLAAGHEIGHHGYSHRSPDQMSAQEQEEDLDRGAEVLRALTGVYPAGYRSPSWEMTPVTFRLLCECGFAYDSSMMGDDRPYIEEHDGYRLLELPVHWTLDDWPFFAWSGYHQGGCLTSPGVWGADWYAEYEAARDEARPITFTMHPEVIGRPTRLAALRGLLVKIQADGNAEFVSHSGLAKRY